MNQPITSKPSSNSPQGSQPDSNGQQSFQIAAPSISLPKGGGAIRGMGEKFGANPVTGTGSMTVPIATSPGRSGFGPQLSLAYDSGAGNGPFGLGWNLSLPSITRKTDKGLPRFRSAEDSDVYVLSGSEDLVPTIGASVVRTMHGVDFRVRRYRPRIEGLFARIERWTNLQTGEMHWRSISKDNVTTFYGRTAESRIADPDDPLRIFSWLICETHDDKGNATVYEYVAEDSKGVDLSQMHERNRTDASRSSNRYLKRIKYGNTPSRLLEPDPAKLAWHFEVVFDYGEHDADQLVPEAGGSWPCRKDPFSSCRGGFEVRTYRLCQRVLMFHRFQELGPAPCLVRSTEFAYSEGPIASFIASATQSGYKRQPDGTYLKKSLPPVEFGYSEATIDETVRTVERASLENLPMGLDGRLYQWADLDGEGLSGVLTEQADAWFYKRNLGDGNFAPLEIVSQKPSPTGLANGAQQLMDLSGDGSLDLVTLERPVQGFYEKNEDAGWENFIAFKSLPNVRWNDPNLRFIDLTGDGHADVLITEEEVFTWYASLAEDGFAEAERTRQPFDEERGPRLVFADSEQSVYLADLSGDGLTDLVRIRNGEVCYWPNLGYGRFGAKVAMDSAPWFDSPDLFDQRRIRLADIDGSGVSDSVYLGRSHVTLWFNQSGNRWSEPHDLQQFQPPDNVASATTVDLLGNGTACLVWSSPLPGDVPSPVRYIDLMGGGKPHLLTSTKNNLGAETKVRYAASTKFYVQDRLEGSPWITRLPFPVHVVERVETFDRISRNRFVTRYAYHHGYFDGVEREFRGFGMVEQFDTEEFAALNDSDAFP